MTPLRVFISYRKEDSSAAALHICARLRSTPGIDRVFHDIDSIPPGAHYQKHIQETILAYDVVLVLIGPHWLSCTLPGSNVPRLFEEKDQLRDEIAEALKQGKVIPVCVSGGKMPDAEELPVAIQDLHYTQGLEVSDKRDHDAQLSRLVEAVLHWGLPETSTGSGTVKDNSRSDPPRTGKHRRKLSIGAMALLASLGFGYYGITSFITPSGKTPRIVQRYSGASENLEHHIVVPTSFDILHHDAVTDEVKAQIVWTDLIVTTADLVGHLKGTKLELTGTAICPLGDWDVSIHCDVITADTTIVGNYDLIPKIGNNLGVQHGVLTLRVQAPTQ